MTSIWQVSSSWAYDRIELIYEKDAKVFSGFEGNAFGNKWHPVRVRIVREQDTVSGDFPYWSAGILVCVEKALEVIRSLIAESVEFLPLECSEGHFYALNVIEVVDCLDRSNSEFTYFKSGSIKRILRWVFKTNCINDRHIFKIPERRGGMIFVSNVFKRVIQENNLKGLEFSKVWED
jgi:hypothetical protein